jgi:hypothetical protein
LFTLAVLGCVAVVVPVVLGTTLPGSRKDPLAIPFRSWRITADVRTALEMVRYVLEPESAPRTGLHDPQPSRTNQTGWTGREAYDDPFGVIDAPGPRSAAGQL